MAHTVTNEYKQVIYSGNSNNKLKLLFNNVELQNADLYCEKVTIKSRIIPNGAKRFSLNNFISKEAEVILHDIDTSIIQDQISISIGTLVGNAYEYVPIGIFNIQDTPTTDKNKTIIKLRDNSVKFDFNYNAKPLIDEKGGSATKLQILQDICTKANVTCNISSFIGSTDLVSIYDNTITARQYIANLAEQAGRIATINRSGELIFVNISSLTTWDIPLSIVEKYEVGTPYKIGRVVYEDAIRKYETTSTNYDTLYLDSSNPYVSSQEQVNSILQQVNNFEIDSLKTGKLLGNPAIDGYDLIQIHDKSKNIFNKNFNPSLSGVSVSTLNTGVKVTTTISGNYKYASYKIGGSELLGKVITLTANMTASANNIPAIYVYIGRNGNTAVQLIGSLLTNGSKTITIPSTFPTNTDSIYVLLYSNTNGTNNVGDYCEYTNLQVEINNYSTDYVPYKDETYTTLATNDLTYTGVLINTFDTQIGEEERKENVTITGEATFKKWATTSINNISGEIDIQAGKIDNVEKEINPTKDLTGTSFHLEDSTDAELVNFELEGKTTQETRSGKNLVDNTATTKTINGLTFTVNNDKTVTVNGTSTANTTFLLSTYSLTAGTYTIKGTSGGGGSTYNMTLAGIVSSYGADRTFTISETKTGNFFIYVANGQTLNNIIFYPMVEKGSTSTEYEQYGAMPSPDYPSELVSVGYQNLYEGSQDFSGTWNNNSSWETDNDTYNGLVVRKRSQAWNGLSKDISIEKGKTYTFSLYAKSTASRPVAIYLRGTSGQITNVETLTFNTTTEWQRYYLTFNATASGILRPRLENTTTVSNNYTYIAGYQIDENSTMRNYIPYGKYGIEVKTTGKNLFDKNNANVLNAYLSAGKVITSSASDRTIYIPCKPNTTYTVSKMVQQTTANNRFALGYSNNIPVLGGSITKRVNLANGTTETKLSITTDSNAKYLLAYIYYQDTSTTFDKMLNSIQIEENNSATTYEEYKGKTYLYTLNQPLRSIGDTKDLLYIKNGMLYVDRKIGSVVLNTFTSKSGSTANNQFSTNVISNIVKPQYGTIVSNILSSHFISKAPNTIYANDTTGIGVNTNGTITCGLGLSSGINTLVLANQWLSTNKPEVNYILAEPYTEELGKVEVPSTYKSITHIDTTNINEPTMDITYVRDTQITNYVEEHISQIIVNEEGITQRVQTIEDSDYDEKINAIELHQTSTDYTINAISQNVTFTEFDEEGNPINSNINSVTTTTGFTFNEDGLNIKKSDTDYNTLIDNTGTYYKDGETIISMTNKDGFLAKDFRLQGQHYYSYNANNPSEPLASENYDFVDERIEIEVDGQTQYAYATFYNGEV